MLLRVRVFESVFSSHYVGPKDWTQVVRLGGKHLNRPSHRASATAENSGIVIQILSPWRPFMEVIPGFKLSFSGALKVTEVTVHAELK